MVIDIDKNNKFRLRNKVYTTKSRTIHEAIEPEF